MSLEDFRDAIRNAASVRTALQIRGGGSKDFFGAVAAGAILDTRGHRGIVAYDPAELVITARCGTPLREIEAALANEKQMLPFEPPHFGDNATLGGCVAAGLAGPRRLYSGAVRDFVLGSTLMDGRGEVLRFGGQVMKNVAGYDVSRLLAGSLGTLALILEVSIKLLPKPVDEATLRFDCEQNEALRRLSQWRGQPLPISASAWHRGALHLRLSGARAAVAQARARLGGAGLDPGEARTFWDDVREQRHSFFADHPADATLWRLALPPASAPLDFNEKLLIEWSGAQRWLASRRDAAEIRTAARTAGGHAVAFRCVDPAVPAFDELPAPLAAVHRRVKAAFDPAGIFNPGRLVRDL